MYGDRLIKVENNELVENKKYFIFRSYTEDQSSECDIFTGIFDYLSIEQHASEDDRIGLNFNYVHFIDIRNMVTLKKLKYDWSFKKERITCYLPKHVHTKSMENRYLKRILKGLIGPDFTHYLLEDIKLDCELLEDNLVSDNKDYEIYEVFRANYKSYWFIMDHLMNIFKKTFHYTKNYFKNKLY